MNDNIDHLRLKKELAEPIKDNDEISRLKKENEILKHELEITNLKLSLKDDDNKIELDLRSKNAYMRSNFT